MSKFRIHTHAGSCRRRIDFQAQGKRVPLPGGVFLDQQVRRVRPCSVSTVQREVALLAESRRKRAASSIHVATSSMCIRGSGYVFIFFVARNVCYGFLYLLWLVAPLQSPYTLKQSRSDTHYRALSPSVDGIVRPCEGQSMCHVLTVRRPEQPCILI